MIDAPARVVCCRCRLFIGTDDTPIRELVELHRCPADRPKPLPVARYGFAVGRVLAAATAAGVGVLLGAVLLLLVALSLSGGRYSASVVLSGSMRPGIQPGDVAILQRVPASSLRVGDVIAYLPPGQTVARIHRLISVKSTTAGLEIQSRGDAAGISDTPVLLQGSEAYRLVAVVPYLGWVWNARAWIWIVAGLALFAAFGLALAGEVRMRRR